MRIFNRVKSNQSSRSGFSRPREAQVLILICGKAAFPDRRGRMKLSSDRHRSLPAGLLLDIMLALGLRISRFRSKPAHFQVLSL
jgi:hypothetical protein